MSALTRNMECVNAQKTRTSTERFYFNPLSTNPTKMSNTLKQFVIDHFVWVRAYRVKIGLEISLPIAHDLHNFIEDKFSNVKNISKAIFKIEYIQLRA